MRVFVVTPPDPAVSLDEAKEHLRVRHDDEDVIIAAYIGAACDHIDGPAGWLGRSLGMQTLEARFDLGWNIQPLRLPYGPVIDLVSAVYLDAQGQEHAADVADFELFGDELVPAGSAFPWDGGSLRREAGRIRYRAGYVDVPPAARAAILLMVGDLYANRETTAIGVSAASIPMSVTVENLLSPLRVYA